MTTKEPSNMQKGILNNEKKLFVPEIKLKCPNCNVEFNIEAMHRIYRAYLTLTRYSRQTSYNAICCECGKHSKVRIPPLHSEQYKCRKCLFIAEKEGKLGYKRNALANKRIE
ncbi:hypothetical protein HYX00_02900 [Candidatus Woesearchaeota archaeon]|nr:hypothetical protein [Candidatus Woesearchaeota archaeon]